MRNFILCIFVTLICVNCSLARAQENVPTTQEHSVAEESKTIRQHRLKKLIEHMSIDNDTLHRQCRYESDIAATPPHKTVVLTFDDGPDPEQTKYILSVLEKYNVPGSFFMIGEKAQAHPDLVSLVQASTHAMIGVHSWSHPNFHDISVVEQTTEVEKSVALFAKTTPQKFFRYPYGNSTCDSNQLVKSLDYKIVGWHVDSCDWAFDHKGVVDLKEALSCGVLPQNRENFLEHVLSSVRTHGGGIILMHEIHPNTIRQLDKIVATLQAEGFTFGRLTDVEFEKMLP